MQFRIIKLTNNDDPEEFTLEITRMRDIRQRIGIIEAGYLDYLELKGRRKHKPSYNILAANDIVLTPCLEEILIIIMNVSKSEMNFMIIIIKRQ